MKHRRVSRLGRATTGASLALVFALVGTGLVGIGPDPTPDVSSEVTEVVPASETAEVGLAEALDTGTDAEMVGFVWDGQQEGAVQVRALDEGRWTEWYELHGDPAEGPDEDSPEFRDQTSAGPIWVGNDVEDVEIRVAEGPLDGLEMHAIDTALPETGFLGIEPAGAIPPQPGIVSRAAWGADENWRNIGNPGCDGNPDYASEVRFSVVHHTVNSNSYSPSESAALIRGIYHFHTHSNRWCDIGYNFIVDRFGQVFEGRAGGTNKAVIGAHTGGYNSGSTGVAVLGNHQEAGVPGATYDALRQILAWKLSYHGVDPHGSTVETTGSSSSTRHPAGSRVQVAAISSHRDTNNTACPGDHLYNLLPQLRNDVGFTVYAHGDARLSCDWNGDGIDTPAIFQAGRWLIKQRNEEGWFDILAGYGDPGDRPVCGDWNGDGVDTMGIYRNGVFYLRNTNSSGVADQAFSYGNPSDTPVVGDWDGNGTDTVGVWRNASWYLRNSNNSGFANATFGYGNHNDRPIAGDWNGDNVDTPGITRAGGWWLRNSNTTGIADVSFGYGNPWVDQPLVGDWNGDNRDSIGVARGSYWYLRNSNSTGVADITFPY